MKKKFRLGLFGLATAAVALLSGGKSNAAHDMWNEDFAQPKVSSSVQATKTDWKKDALVTGCKVGAVALGAYAAYALYTQNQEDVSRITNQLFSELTDAGMSYMSSIYKAIGNATGSDHIKTVGYSLSPDPLTKAWAVWQSGFDLEKLKGASQVAGATYGSIQGFLIGTAVKAAWTVGSALSTVGGYVGEAAASYWGIE